MNRSKKVDENICLLMLQVKRHLNMGTNSINFISIVYKQFINTNNDGELFYQKSGYYTVKF